MKALPALVLLSTALLACSDDDGAPPDASVADVAPPRDSSVARDMSGVDGRPDLRVADGAAVDLPVADIATRSDSISSRPPGWICVSEYYGDGTCDCGCGAVDVDCHGGVGCTTPGCKDASCFTCWNDEGWEIDCTPGSLDWSCDYFYYEAEDGCDCGCTIPDPDCGPSGGCTTPGCSDPVCEACYNDAGQSMPCD